MNSAEISFYADTMIVEAVLGNKDLCKKAGVEDRMGELISKLTSYISSKINPNDKIGSLINYLGPGVISATFSAMRLGWVGILFGLAASTLHLDLASVLRSIWDGIKSAVSGDKPTTPAQVDSIVKSAVQAGTGSQIQIKSFDQRLRMAKLVRISMEDYDTRNLSLTSDASFVAVSTGIADVLSLVLGWIFKVALKAAGLMVAGDAINLMVGRPNSLNGTRQEGSDSESSSSSSSPQATQTKFPLKGDSQIPFMLPVQNTDDNIDNAIIGFAKDTYSGLDGKEGMIKQTPGFRAVKDKISWYNHSTKGENGIYFPQEFKSKKALTDFFIDDVAKAQ